jgi:bifunctional DNase/RNase
MAVVKVSPYMRAEKPLMWLCEKDSSAPRLLPVAVGEFEAAAIQMHLGGEKPLRPISYDLFATLMEELHVPMRRIVIHSVEGQVFHAAAVVESDGRLREVDCRPSDGVALALRSQASIFVSAELLDQAGIRASQGDGVGEAISKFYELEPQILGQRREQESLTLPDPAEMSSPQVPDPLANLEHRLEQAVICEEYEEAAQIRDEIERVKSSES